MCINYKMLNNVTVKNEYFVKSEEMRGLWEGLDF